MLAPLAALICPRLDPFVIQFALRDDADTPVISDLVFSDFFDQVADRVHVRLARSLVLCIQRALQRGAVDLGQWLAELNEANGV